MADTAGFLNVSPIRVRPPAPPPSSTGTTLSLFMTLLGALQAQVPPPPSLLRLVADVTRTLARFPPLALAATPTDEAGVCDALHDVLLSVYGSASGGAQVPAVTAMLGLAVKQASLERLAQVLVLLRVDCTCGSAPGACKFVGLPAGVAPFLSELRLLPVPRPSPVPPALPAVEAASCAGRSVGASVLAELHRLATAYLPEWYSGAAAGGARLRLEDCPLPDGARPAMEDSLRCAVHPSQRVIGTLVDVVRSNFEAAGDQSVLWALRVLVANLHALSGAPQGVEAPAAPPPAPASCASGTGWEALASHPDVVGTGNPTVAAARRLLLRLAHAAGDVLAAPVVVAVEREAAHGLRLGFAVLFPSVHSKWATVQWLMSSSPPPLVFAALLDRLAQDACAAKLLASVFGEASAPSMPPAPPVPPAAVRILLQQLVEQGTQASLDALADVDAHREPLVGAAATSTAALMALQSQLVSMWTAAVQAHTTAVQWVPAVSSTQPPSTPPRTPPPDTPPAVLFGAVVFHVRTVVEAASVLLARATGIVKAHGAGSNAAASVHTALASSTVGLPLQALLSLVSTAPPMPTFCTSLLQPLGSLLHAVDKYNQAATPPPSGWSAASELAAAVVVGRCISSMVMGHPVSAVELKWEPWLRSPLFAGGLHGDGSADAPTPAPKPLPGIRPPRNGSRSVSLPVTAMPSPDDNPALARSPSLPVYPSRSPSPAEDSRRRRRPMQAWADTGDYDALLDWAVEDGLDDDALVSRSLDFDPPTPASSVGRPPRPSPSGIDALDDAPLSRSMEMDMKRGWGRCNRAASGGDDNDDSLASRPLPGRPPKPLVHSASADLGLRHRRRRPHSLPPEGLAPVVAPATGGRSLSLSSVKEGAGGEDASPARTQSMPPGSPWTPPPSQPTSLPSPGSSRRTLPALGSTTPPSAHRPVNRRHDILEVLGSDGSRPASSLVAAVNDVDKWLVGWAGAAARSRSLSQPPVTPPTRKALSPLALPTPPSSPTHSPTCPPAARRAVASVLLRVCGCVDVFLDAVHSRLMDKGKPGVPPEALLAVWRQAAACVDPLFPDTGEGTADGGDAPLVRRIVATCAFLRSLAVTGSPAAVGCDVVLPSAGQLGPPSAASTADAALSSDVAAFVTQVRPEELADLKSALRRRRARAALRAAGFGLLSRALQRVESHAARRALVQHLPVALSRPVPTAVSPSGWHHPLTTTVCAVGGTVPPAAADVVANHPSTQQHYAESTQGCPSGEAEALHTAFAQLFTQAVELLRAAVGGPQDPAAVDLEDALVRALTLRLQPHGAVAHGDPLVAMVCASPLVPTLIEVVTRPGGSGEPQPATPLPPSMPGDAAPTAQPVLLPAGDGALDGPPSAPARLPACAWRALSVLAVQVGEAASSPASRPPGDVRLLWGGDAVDTAPPNTPLLTSMSPMSMASFMASPVLGGASATADDMESLHLDGRDGTPLVALQSLCFSLLGALRRCSAAVDDLVEAEASALQVVVRRHGAVAAPLCVWVLPVVDAPPALKGAPVASSAAAAHWCQLRQHESRFHTGVPPPSPCLDMDMQWAPPGDGEQPPPLEAAARTCGRLGPVWARLPAVAPRDLQAAAASGVGLSLWLFPHSSFVSPGGPRRYRATVAAVQCQAGADTAAPAAAQWPPTAGRPVPVLRTAGTGAHALITLCLDCIEDGMVPAVEVHHLDADSGDWRLVSTLLPHDPASARVQGAVWHHVAVGWRFDGRTHSATVWLNGSPLCHLSPVHQGMAPSSSAAAAVMPRVAYVATSPAPRHDTPSLSAVQFVGGVDDVRVFVGDLDDDAVSTLHGLGSTTGRRLAARRLLVTTCNLLLVTKGLCAAVADSRARAVFGTAQWRQLLLRLLARVQHLASFDPAAIVPPSPGQSPDGLAPPADGSRHVLHNTPVADVVMQTMLGLLEVVLRGGVPPVDAAAPVVDHTSELLGSPISPLSQVAASVSPRSFMASPVSVDGGALGAIANVVAAAWWSPFSDGGEGEPTLQAAYRGEVVLNSGAAVPNASASLPADDDSSTPTDGFLASLSRLSCNSFAQAGSRTAVVSAGVAVLRTMLESAEWVAAVSATVAKSVPAALDSRPCGGTGAPNHHLGTLLAVGLALGGCPDRVHVGGRVLVPNDGNGYDSGVVVRLSDGHRYAWVVLDGPSAREVGMAAEDEHSRRDASSSRRLADAVKPHPVLGVSVTQLLPVAAVAPSPATLPFSPPLVALTRHLLGQPPALRNVPHSHTPDLLSTLQYAHLRSVWLLALGNLLRNPASATAFLGEGLLGPLLALATQSVEDAVQVSGVWGASTDGGETLSTSSAARQALLRKVGQAVDAVELAAFNARVWERLAVWLPMTRPASPSAAPPASAEAVPTPTADGLPSLSCIPPCAVTATLAEAQHEVPLFRPRLACADLTVEALSGELHVNAMRVRALSYFPTARLADAAVPAGAGVWYFEVLLLSAGVMQVGWAGIGFRADQDAGRGVGDDGVSWSYDGSRRCKWHGHASEAYGHKWVPGDVVGCWIDTGEVASPPAVSVGFTLNGVDLGTAFDDAGGAGGRGAFSGEGAGVFPALSLEQGQQIDLNFGHKPFVHAPPRRLLGGNRRFRPVAAVVPNALQLPLGAASGTDAMAEGGAGGVGDGTPLSPKDAMVDRLLALGLPAEWCLKAAASEDAAVGGEAGAVAWVVQQASDTDGDARLRRLASAASSVRSARSRRRAPVSDSDSEVETVGVYNVDDDPLSPLSHSRPPHPPTDAADVEDALVSFLQYCHAAAQQVQATQGRGTLTSTTSAQDLLLAMALRGGDDGMEVGAALSHYYAGQASGGHHHLLGFLGEGGASPRRTPNASAAASATARDASHAQLGDEACGEVYVGPPKFPLPLPSGAVAAAAHAAAAHATAAGSLLTLADEADDREVWQLALASDAVLAVLHARTAAVSLLTHAKAGDEAGHAVVGALRAPAAVLPSLALAKLCLFRGPALPCCTCDGLAVGGGSSHPLYCACGGVCRTADVSSGGAAALHGPGWGASWDATPQWAGDAFEAVFRALLTASGDDADASAVVSPRLYASVLQEEAVQHFRLAGRPTHADVAWGSTDRVLAAVGDGKVSTLPNVEWAAWLWRLLATSTAEPRVAGVVHGVGGFAALLSTAYAANMPLKEAVFRLATVALHRAMGGATCPAGVTVLWQHLKVLASMRLPQLVSWRQRKERLTSSLPSAYLEAGMALLGAGHQGRALLARWASKVGTPPLGPATAAGVAAALGIRVPHLFVEHRTTSSITLSLLSLSGDSTTPRLLPGASMTYTLEIALAGGEASAALLPQLATGDTGSASPTRARLPEPLAAVLPGGAVHMTRRLREHLEGGVRAPVSDWEWMAGGGATPVDAKLDAEPVFTQVATGVPPLSDFTVCELDPDTTYRFRLTVAGEVGDDDLSSLLQGLGAPPPSSDDAFEVNVASCAGAVPAGGHAGDDWRGDDVVPHACVTCGLHGRQAMGGAPAGSDQVTTLRPPAGDVCGCGGAGSELVLRVGRRRQAVSGASAVRTVEFVRGPLPVDTVTDTAFGFDASACGSNLYLHHGLLTVTNLVHKKWNTVRATAGFSSGVNYFEAYVQRCVSKNIFVGVCTAAAPLNNYVGSDRNGWGYLANRALWHNKAKARAYGQLFREGDTIGVLLDMDAGTLSFFRNGTDLGVAVDGLAGVGTLYPAFSLYNRDDQLQLLPASCASSQRSGGGAACVAAGRRDAQAAAVMRHLGGSLAASELPVPVLARLATLLQLWKRGALVRVRTLHGAIVWLDASDEACGAFGLHAGDTVATAKGEAIVHGVNGDLLFVTLSSMSGGEAGGGSGGGGRPGADVATPWGQPTTCAVSAAIGWSKKECVSLAVVARRSVTPRPNTPVPAEDATPEELEAVGAGGAAVTPVPVLRAWFAKWSPAMDAELGGLLAALGAGSPWALTYEAVVPRAGSGLEAAGVSVKEVRARAALHRFMNALLEPGVGAGVAPHVAACRGLVFGPLKVGHLRAWLVGTTSTTTKGESGGEETIGVDQLPTFAVDRSDPVVLPPSPWLSSPARTTAAEVVVNGVLAQLASQLASVDPTLLRASVAVDTGPGDGSGGDSSLTPRRAPTTQSFTVKGVDGGHGGLLGVVAAAVSAPPLPLVDPSGAATRTGLHQEHMQKTGDSGGGCGCSWCAVWRDMWMCVGTFLGLALRHRLPFPVVLAPTAWQCLVGEADDPAYAPFVAGFQQAVPGEAVALLTWRELAAAVGAPL